MTDEERKKIEDDLYIKLELKITNTKDLEEKFNSVKKYFAEGADFDSFYTVCKLKAIEPHQKLIWIKKTKTGKGYDTRTLIAFLLEIFRIRGGRITLLIIHSFTTPDGDYVATTIASILSQDRRTATRLK